MRRIFPVNNLDACIFHQMGAAFENSNDVEGCLGACLFRFGNAAQRRVKRHSNSNKRSSRWPALPSRMDKDERGNLLLTKGGDVRDLVSLMFFLFCCVL